MIRNRYDRICEVFLAVCELSGTDRDRVLDGETAGDPTLRAEVARLLDADCRGEELLRGMDGAAWSGRRLVNALAGSVAGDAPDRIGSYRIVRRLADGGMGTVYEAERDETTFALKVVRADLASPGMLRRFEYESDVLGRLDHPGIARIHETGTARTALGEQPYFAMEMVDGEPILEYADRHDLSTRDRLELFALVCDAVHHAHQKGVVHRDLKPGNILVVDRQPKVLDFGVARAVGGQRPPLGARTDVGQLVGTVPYMSPEQAGGIPDEIDTRSDVYTLGVLAFELLTGRLPYAVHGQMVHEAVRVIREDDPTRLGTIDPRLRGDVETIVGKALEKDKERRYDSAAGLAADVRRHLSSEPIVARPASLGYQVGRFARGHRSLVGGVLAATAMLVVAVAGTTIGMVQARIGEQGAERARDEAEVVTRFLERMLAAADPAESGRDVLVRDLLDQATRSIGTDLSEAPLVEARLRHTLGGAYTGLGIYDAAGVELRRAVEIRRRELGVDHPATLDSETKLAQTLLDQGRLEEAESLLDDLLDRRRLVLGPAHPSTLETRKIAATLDARLGRLDEAERELLDVMTSARERSGPEDPVHLSAMSNLVALYWRKGRYEAMFELAERTLELQRRAFGPEDPRTLKTMSNLAVASIERGRFADAEALQRELIGLQRRRLGAEHPGTLKSMHNLAVLHRRMGRWAGAEPLYREVLEARTRTLGATHPLTALSMLGLGAHQARLGRYAEAEPLLVRALALTEEQPGKLTPPRVLGRRALAMCCAEQGRLDEADTLLLPTLERARLDLGDTHPGTIDLLLHAGELRRRQGQLEEAVAMLQEAVAASRERFGASHPASVAALGALGETYLDQGRLEDAGVAFRESLATARDVLPPEHPKRGFYLTRLGRWLVAVGRNEEAVVVLEEATSELRRGLGDDHPWTRAASGALRGASGAAVSTSIPMASAVVRCPPAA